MVRIAIAAYKANRNALTRPSNIIEAIATKIRNESVGFADLDVSVDDVLGAAALAFFLGGSVSLFFESLGDLGSACCVGGLIRRVPAFSRLALLFFSTTPSSRIIPVIVEKRGSVKRRISSIKLYA